MLKGHGGYRIGKKCSKSTTAAREQNWLEATIAVREKKTQRIWQLPKRKKKCSKNMEVVIALQGNASGGFCWPEKVASGKE